MKKKVSQPRKKAAATALIPVTGKPAVSLDVLLCSLRSIIREARQQTLRAFDVVQVRTCWLVGRHIVEFEQGGAARAAYGKDLLARVSAQLTAEFGAGFDRWNLYKMSQFYRLFRSGDQITGGAICLVEQSEFMFYFIALRSRASDGRILVTWNYPFSYGLHQSPKTTVNRAGGEKSIEEMILLHRAFLERETGSGLCPLEASSLRRDIQDDLRRQLDHNLACGILKNTGDSTIGYTVRGMFFLWFQFLRDFVRFS